MNCKSFRQEFTKLKVGDIGVANDPGLIQLFQDWTLVELEAKNGILSVYNNGTLIKSIEYNTTGKNLQRGKLKNISVGFKGLAVLTG